MALLDTIIDIFKAGVPTEFIADFLEGSFDTFKSKLEEMKDRSGLAKELLGFLENENDVENIWKVVEELGLAKKSFLDKVGEKLLLKHEKETEKKKQAKILVRNLFKIFKEQYDAPLNREKLEESKTYRELDEANKGKVEAIINVCIDGMKKANFGRLEENNRVVVNLINSKIDEILKVELLPGITSSIKEVLASLQQQQMSTSEIAQLSDDEITKNPYIWVKRKCPYCGNENNNLYYDKSLQTVYCGACGKTYDVIWDASNENKELLKLLEELKIKEDI